MSALHSVLRALTHLCSRLERALDTGSPAEGDAATHPGLVAGSEDLQSSGPGRAEEGKPRLRAGTPEGCLCAPLPHPTHAFSLLCFCFADSTPHPTQPVHRILTLNPKVARRVLGPATTSWRSPPGRSRPTGLRCPRGGCPARINRGEVTLSKVTPGRGEHNGSSREKKKISPSSFWLHGGPALEQVEKDIWAEQLRHADSPSVLRRLKQFVKMIFYQGPCGRQKDRLQMYVILENRSD